MGKFAIDPKSALPIFPVQHAYPLPSYLGWSGLQGQGDMFLQGTELPLRLSLEGVAEHAAVGMAVQQWRGELVGPSREAGEASCAGSGRDLGKS